MSDKDKTGSNAGSSGASNSDVNDVTDYDTLTNEVLKRAKLPTKEDIIREVLDKIPKPDVVDINAFKAELDAKYEAKIAPENKLDKKTIEDIVRQSVTGVEAKIPDQDKVKEWIKPTPPEPKPDYLIKNTENENFGDILAGQAANLILNKAIDNKYKKEAGGK